MTTNDDWLAALAATTPGDPLPEPPPRTSEQQVVDEWGEEHARLMGDHVRDLARGRFDNARRDRLVELRTILESAGEDQQ